MRVEMMLQITEACLEVWGYVKELYVKDIN